MFQSKSTSTKHNGPDDTSQNVKHNIDYSYTRMYLIYKHILSRFYVTERVQVILTVIMFSLVLGQSTMLRHCMSRL